MALENREQTDIQPKQKIQQEETLDSILQSKTNDPNTLQKAKSIFEEVQKKCQQPINDYIKGLDTKQINYIVNKETDPVKYLIEDIDMTIGQKTIDVTKNEAVNITNDNVNITNDKQGKTETKKTEIEVNNNIAQINKQAELTKESYDQLDNKYKINDEEINRIKSDEKNKDFIKTITDKTQGTEIQVDDYLKFYLTAQNKELKDTKFIKDFSNLNEKLGFIPDTTPLSSTAKPKITDQIIDSNKNLQDYIHKSDTLNDIKLPIDKQLSYSDEEFDLYVKFIDDPKIKTTIQKQKKEIQDYAKDIEKNDKNTDKNISDAYEAYTDEVAKIKENISSSTESIIQKRVLGSCISGLASYFDSTTIDKKTNFADDFRIDTQKGFNIEDDVLSINGKINGSDVGFEYNMIDDKNANIKSKDFLEYNPISKNFSLGTENGASNDLGIKMPTIDYLSQQAQRFSQDNFQKTISENSDIETFQTAFKKNLSDTLAKSFGAKTIVETRIKRNIQKNITTQTLKDAFIPKTTMAKIDQKGSINTSEKTTRTILNIRNKTTKDMRSDELENFTTLSKRFDNVLENLKNNDRLEDKRKGLLSEVRKEKSGESEDRGENILNFFQKISNNDKINVEDFNLLVNILETDAANIGENMSKFSAEFQTKEIQESADKLLDGL